MTPQEIYALPSTRDQRWTTIGADLVDVIFDVSHRSFDRVVPEPFAAEDDIVVSTKLEWFDGDETTVKIRTVAFHGIPFAVLLTSGDDRSELVVTDAVHYRAAKAVVLKSLTTGMGHARLDEAASARIEGYGGVRLVRTDDGARLVPPHLVGETGRLLFDERAFDAARIAAFPDGGPKTLSGEETLAAVLALYKAAMPSDAVVVDVFNPDGDWIAMALADGGYTRIVAVPGRAVDRAHGWRDPDFGVVGPASLLEVYVAAAKGDSVSIDGPAVREIVETFSTGVPQAMTALEGFSRTLNSDLCMAVLEAMGYEPPFNIHDERDMLYGKAAYVAENESAAKYCLDGYPSVKQARELVASLARNRAKDAADAAKALTA